MKYFILLLSFVFTMLVVNTDIEAQVRKKTTTKKSTKVKEDKVKLMDKLNPEIKFGNLGFFNGLSVSTKANIGYKLHDRFSAGIGGKLFYDQFSVQGPDPSILDYGGLIYGRGKITKEIYFQAEYALMNYAYSDLFINRGFPGGSNRSINYPLLGIGYASGGDNWKLGIELLYIVNQEAQDLQRSVVEYWFGASFHF